MSEALKRFARVVVGQALGAGVTVALATYTFVPELQTGYGTVIAVLIGSLLTAVDKYLRDKGLYQPSLENQIL